MANIFQCMFLNENIEISINNSLKFAPTGPIHNIPALVQIMTWRSQIQALFKACTNLDNISEAATVVTWSQ